MTTYEKLYKSIRFYINKANTARANCMGFGNSYNRLMDLRNAIASAYNHGEISDEECDTLTAEISEFFSY